jgi:hypothetical protein
MPGQRKRNKPPRERPYVSNLELREALSERLNVRELNALEKQIRTAGEIATERAVFQAVKETHQRDWATIMRVLIDRFGFEPDALARLWDAALEYLGDIKDGHITAREMLDTLANEDGVHIAWTIKE